MKIGVQGNVFNTSTANMTDFGSHSPMTYRHANDNLREPCSSTTVYTLLGPRGLERGGTMNQEKMLNALT